jgi:hypothetical protein
MPDLDLLKAQRCALLEDLIELRAAEMALDLSKPLPPRIRNLVYSSVIVACQAWSDLVTMNANVEPTSPIEKALLELCHLDRTLSWLSMG